MKTTVAPLVRGVISAVLSAAAVTSMVFVDFGLGICLYALAAISNTATITTNLPSDLTLRDLIAKTRAPAAFQFFGPGGFFAVCGFLILILGLFYFFIQMDRDVEPYRSGSTYLIYGSAILFLSALYVSVFALWRTRGKF